MEERLSLGKYIANRRKYMKLTQTELAEGIEKMRCMISAHRKACKGYLRVLPVDVWKCFQKEAGIISSKSTCCSRRDRNAGLSSSNFS